NPFDILNWANTECVLQNKPAVPSRPLPAFATHTNSLIIDREGSKISDSDITNLFKTSAIGFNFAKERNFLQIFFNSQQAAKEVLNNGPYKIRDQTLPIFPPRGLLPNIFDA